MRNKLIASLLIFNLVSLSPFNFSIAYAQEAPNREGLTTSITQEASQATSNIYPSSGSSNTTNVVNSGDSVNTDTNSNTESTTAVNNNNEANVSQAVTADANTGYNEASRNIAIGGNAGVIVTGDAAVNVFGVVGANSNNTSVAGGGGGSGNTTTVTNTGNSLSTATNANSQTLTAVNNNNTTVINQVTSASANTGGNIADRNISIGGAAGVILTGNASVNVNYLVTANGSIALIGGDGNGSGPGSGASIVILNTGDNSRFANRTNTQHYLIVSNENRALVSQSCGLPLNNPGLLVDAATCYANTGGNNASNNIAFGGNAGAIRTNDATVNVVMDATVNSNKTAVGGSGPGAGDPTVINTGDNVEVTADSNQLSSTQVDNINTARINQNVRASANTGYNTANRNISIGGNAGLIQTGQATVNVLLLADANRNRTDISTNFGFGTAPGLSTSVVNTGDNTSIHTSTNSTHTIAVNNHNWLDILQSVFAFANTGHNRADRNIGSVTGVIATGRAEVNVKAAVTANENVTEIDPGRGGVSPSPIPTPTPTGHEEKPTPGPVGGVSDDGERVSDPPLLGAAIGPRGGAVLGAAVLPMTGAETLLSLVVSGLALGLGGYLKRKRN